MRILRGVLVLLVLSAMPLAAQTPPPTTLDQVIDRIIAREAQEIGTIRQYSPLVETYIQKLRYDKQSGNLPDGDDYFMGRADFTNGVDLVSLTEPIGLPHKLFGGLASWFSPSVEFLPRGFLQMVFLDTDGFDRVHYKFDYVRREFVGEVRCLVFDVTPKPKSGKGRFIGRIWVEDRDFTIVRFNGAYGGSSRTSYYFHFDSWRVNTGPQLWLPAFIYSEESSFKYGLAKRLHFRAQTRLWGYNLGHAQQEQELSKVLVEAATPVQDTSQAANDVTPIQAQRTWDRQAADNVIDRLQRLGLLAPPGEVDKVLDTVVNNLEVTNNLDMQPEVRCRVLMTSTLESFTVGHTIVFSRGLVDVLPDEATLATMVAHELAHVVLGHRMDSQYAFFDRLLVKDKDTFRHFDFARTPSEEEAANKKAMELIEHSPYKDQLANARLFAQALASRSKEIPNLISAHLGDRVSVLPVLQNVAAPADAKAETTAIAALPLGGRIKFDPWSDELTMIKSKPVGTLSEREKMPFELTPFMPYLTREPSVGQTGPAVAADAKPDQTKKP